MSKTIKAFQPTKAEERAFQKFVEETWYPQEADMETLPAVEDDEPAAAFPDRSDRTAPLAGVGAKALDTDADPSPKPSAARLRRYWTRGPGAAKIRWGEEGDFYRCVAQLGKYVEDPKGLCNVYHRSALGAPPGQGHKGAEFDLEEKDFPEPAEVKRVMHVRTAAGVAKYGQPIGTRIVKDKVTGKYVPDPDQEKPEPKAPKQSEPPALSNQETGHASNFKSKRHSPEVMALAKELEEDFKEKYTYLREEDYFDLFDDYRGNGYKAFNEYRRGQELDIAGTDPDALKIGDNDPNTWTPITNELQLKRARALVKKRRDDMRKRIGYQVRALEEGFEGIETKRDITSYRVMRASIFGPDGPKAGMEFIDRGFVSTTIDREYAVELYEKSDVHGLNYTKEDGVVLMEIKVPKGSNAIYLTGFVGGNENELTLNGARFTITSVRQEGTVFYAEVESADV